MNKTEIRLISLLLVVVFCFTAFGCGKTDAGNNGITSEATTEATVKTTKPQDTEAPLNTFTLNAKYNIVTNSMYKKTAEISESIMIVKNALAFCGLESFITTESESNTEVAEYEILIGQTSRPDSSRILNSLKIDDYAYEIVSENVIVICGGSLEATYKAAKQFCLDILGYDADTKNGSQNKANLNVTVGQNFSFNVEYPYDSLTVNGVDIKDFSIAVNDTQQMALAQKIQRYFGSYTGYCIPIIKSNELDGNEKGVFCIGAFSRDGSEFYDALVPGGVVCNSVNGDKVTVGIDAYNNSYFVKLINDFLEQLTLKSENNVTDITLPENDIEIYDLDIAYGDIPEWILIIEKETVVRDGVTYIEQLYRDENNRPYRAFILKVDPNKASLYMGSTNDEYTDIPEGRQSVIGHMQSAVANGVDVIAGTNGGFFYISSDYSPIGLTIKEGELISNSDPSRAFVGFTKDGRMVIGSNSSKVDKSNLLTAIGGRNMIVHNSLPYELEKNDEFGTTYHPRTLAGVTEDGTMILAVIDGRRSKHSNGASLAVAARFMISLGAVDAVNLDGGGSSTMVIRDGDNYSVKNSPSDGSPRKIYNSLLVVAK